MTPPNDYYVGLLDGKGYVRLLDTMGDDLAVVNAARASFAKESQELSEKDTRLIRYLATHQHWSPFRVCVLSFEIKAPLMVCRQWHTHVVASQHLDEQRGWNEQSRRYVTDEPEFYVPTVWRSAPANAKQGSGEPMSTAGQREANAALDGAITAGLDKYRYLLAIGVAPEQARLCLPAYALYTTWRWTCSLQALSYFIQLREEEHAQAEIVEYAHAVHALAQPCFPVSLEALLGTTTKKETQ